MLVPTILSYAEIKNMLITSVIDDEFNDIRLVARLELAADRIYDELFTRVLEKSLKNN